MKTIWSTKVIVSVLCVALLSLTISGCSTVESRREERAQGFDLLTKEQQRVVMQGRVTKGLSKDGVYIALGKPLRVRREHMNGVGTESWVYGRMETYTAPGSYAGPVFYGRYGAWWGPGYYDNSVSVMRDTFVVFFGTDGKVKGWSEL
ncbi:MAG: hypothetical protein LBK60_04675 [Verrucomicrobiales bacterium]|jgi:hypothetical protein|nr:hypothetical protein [Verrucomicrobiales bacterium]